MDNIRFAEDYGAMARAEKSEWLAQKYLRTRPPPGNTQEPQTVVPEAKKADFESWKGAFGHTTLARNRLRELFRLVRFIQHFPARPSDVRAHSLVP